MLLTWLSESRNHLSVCFSPSEDTVLTAFGAALHSLAHPSPFLAEGGEEKRKNAAEKVRAHAVAPNLTIDTPPRSACTRLPSCVPANSLESPALTFPPLSEDSFHLICSDSDAQRDAGHWRCYEELRAPANSGWSRLRAHPGRKLNERLLYSAFIYSFLRYVPIVTFDCAQ